MSRNRTSSIARPASVDRSPTTDRRNRLADFTTSIPRNRQVVEGRGRTFLIWPLSLLLAVLLIAALFVVPVRDWMGQSEAIAAKEAELAAIEDANGELAAEIALLQTPEGVERAAREELGYITPGEQRLTVLPTPSAPLTLPTGWPYDAVSQILAARSIGAAAATTP
jgi:cell division protein FtsB